METFAALRSSWGFARYWGVKLIETAPEVAGAMSVVALGAIVYFVRKQMEN